MATKLNESAAGMYVISATPFTEGGALDLDSTRSLMDFYLQCGVTGFTILGIMGEAPKLSNEESMSFATTAMQQINGKAPVIVGASAAGLDNLANFSRKVMDAGAAGVMVAPIPGLKSDEQVYGYFEQVAKRLEGIPWVLQDYPQVTTVYMSPTIILKMIADFANLVMVKHEDWPGLSKISKLREAEKKGARRVSILVGNGGIHYPQELARGVDGAMTGFAYPEALVQTYDLFKAGKTEESEDVYDAYLPIVRQELQPGLGLAVRKYILMQRGAIKSEAIRAPGPRLAKLDKEEVDHLVRRMERRVKQLGSLAPQRRAA
jgi:4-hydroxy-tetrahydrodipicolinate synthase